VGEVMRSALRLRLDDGCDDGSAFVLLETGGCNRSWMEVESFMEKLCCVAFARSLLTRCASATRLRSVKALSRFQRCCRAIKAAIGKNHLAKSSCMPCAIGVNGRRKM